MIDIAPVRADSEIASVASLAQETWTEHYTPLIGRRQVDYMLSRFQSAPAIREQITGGYLYYTVSCEGRPAGYFALVPQSGESTAQLSKIYVLKELRGQGLGRAIVEFASAWCRRQGIGQLWLTVNRHNAGSIAFYEQVGFVRSGALVQEIGEGFVMDDYRMVKTLTPAAEADGMPGAA
jgi:GNAT superfamily N-acetyltransferase